jgi:hypothetical protein
VSGLAEAALEALEMCTDALEHLPPRMMTRLIASLMAQLVVGFHPEDRTIALRKLMADFREARALLEAEGEQSE